MCHGLSTCILSTMWLQVTSISLFNFYYKSYLNAVDCPEGYEYDPANDTCYKFVSTPTPWFDARYDCTDVPDGDLVVINNQIENDFVLDKINSMGGNGTDWWIGASNRKIIL